MRLFKTSTVVTHGATRGSIATPRPVAVFLTAASMLAALLAPGVVRPTVVRSGLANSVVPPVGNQVVSTSPRPPLTFIENVGQFDERARFQLSGGNTTLFLADDALWVTLMKPAPEANSKSGLEGLSATNQAAAGRRSRRVAIKLSFIGANPQPRLEPFDRLDTNISYLTGNDAAGWHTRVPAWASVRYVELYPGLDWEITSQNGRLVQRLVARDRSSPQNVRLRVEGIEDLTLDGNHMRFTTALGDSALPLPTLEGAVPDGQPVVQEVGHGAFEVSAPFASTTSSAVDSLPSADVSSLIFSTYLGAGCEDRGFDIAIDSRRNIYVVGDTASTAFPTTPGAYDVSFNDCGLGCVIGDNSGDVFVTRLGADGHLMWSTYLGGERYDGAVDVVVDGAGNVYVTGATFSANFPTTGNALDRELSGGRDAFVAKLNAGGNQLLYSTFLGGNAWDYGNSIALDGAGHAYVGGFTHGGFPTTPGAMQEIFGGLGDGFVVKLNAEGNQIIYSTYIGGNSYESVPGIAVDGAGNAYLAGATHSNNFPTTPGAWDSACNSCQTNVSTDGYVAKLSADGGRLIYSTYLGGETTPGGENLSAIAVDGAGNAFVVGNSSVGDFPTTAQAVQPDFGGGPKDATLTKLNAIGSTLIYSTYLGGSGADQAIDIAIDNRGNAHVLGRSASTDFPIVNAWQATPGGGYDAFLVQFNSTGEGLIQSTYFGGSSDDFHISVGGIATDATGCVYFTGSTSSSDFPTTDDAPQPDFAGGASDVFVVKMGLAKPAGSQATLHMPIVQCDERSVD
jgi:hypothetical protein